MGKKRQKQQEVLVGVMKESNEALGEIATKMDGGNDLLAASNASFDRAAQYITDIKLLQLLPPGSQEYLDVLNEIKARRNSARGVTPPAPPAPSGDSTGQ